MKSNAALDSRRWQRDQNAERELLSLLDGDMRSRTSATTPPGGIRKGLDGPADSVEAPRRDPDSSLALRQGLGDKCFTDSNLRWTHGTSSRAGSSDSDFSPGIRGN